MNNKLVIAVSLAAGRGLLARYVAPPSTFAQNQAPITKEIRAQSFTLVDPADRTIGTFTSEPDGSPGWNQPGPAPKLNIPQPQRTVVRMRIVLRDSNGREIWSAPDGAKFRQLSEAR